MDERGVADALRNRAAPTIDVIGRISGNATIATANSEIEAIAKRLEQEYPETNREWGTPIVMDAEVKARVDAIWSELGL